MSFQFSERHSIESLTYGHDSDPSGMLFLNRHGQTDLSGLTYLHSGVDTVRQLWIGRLESDFLTKLVDVYDLGVNSIGQFFGSDFVVRGGGRTSGYRYRLQNNELGVIVHVGGFFTDLEAEGSHLKVELSPHFIEERSHSEICDYLASISMAVLGASNRASGCAVHLCVHYQGFKLPNDFLDNYVTYSRKIFNASGIGELFLDGNSVAFNYNDGETLTIGSSTSIQTCSYIKSVDAVKKDKIDYWASVWGSQYDSSRPVYCFEVRLHQSVMKEYGQFQNKLDGTSFDYKFVHYREFKGILTDIWRTVLTSNRYMLSKMVIHPFWQSLMEDVKFYDADSSGTIYKRVRKKTVASVARNIANFLGNSLSLYARHGYTAKQAIHYIKKSGIWGDIVLYIELCKDMSISDFYQWISEQLALKRLVGTAA